MTVESDSVPFYDREVGKPTGYSISGLVDDAIGNRGSCSAVITVPLDQGNESVKGAVSER